MSPVKNFAIATLIAVSAVPIAACGTSTNTQNTTSATAAATVASSTAAAPQLTGGPSGLGPGDEICQVQGTNGGTYYLHVTSMNFHDLSQCDAGTPLQTDTDGLFTDPDYGPNLDRRCIYGPNTDTAVKAIVGVYSSSREIDRAAATDVCEEHHGSNS